MERAGQVTLAAWLAANDDLDRADRELLAANVLETSRARVIARSEMPLTGEQLRLLDRLAERRRGGEPAAYLFGEREFFGLKLKVNSAVLVPRPETELLVETVLGKAKPGRRVLDLGTGSGCIAIAIKMQRPDLLVTAADRSSAALAVAAENAARHHADIAFLQSDWLQAIGGRFDLIAANPPYVAAGHPALAALRHEPEAALLGGSDGLDALKTIIRQAAGRLASDGWLCVEHGHDQAPAVASRMRLQGYEQVTTQQDLGGHPRVTSGRSPGLRQASV